MKRSTSIPRNQLALFLEPRGKHQLDAETREALIVALANLLLEAYGMEEETETGDRGGHHER